MEPQPQPLVESFLAQARRRPEAAALVWRQESVSYGGLIRWAEHERRRVAELGTAAPGEPVGVPAVKAPETIALILACLMERRPCLLPSPTLGADALNRLYEQADCRQVLTPESPPAAPVHAPARPATPTYDHTFVLTTSGSTGTPKIVPLGAGAVARFIRWAGEQFGIGEGTSVLNYAPLNFDLCLLDVWTTLARGGRAVLVDPDRATHGDHLLDLVARHRVEVVQAVPMFYGLIAGAARQQRRTLPSVRHVVFTGDSMPVPVLAELPRLFGGARLYNLYGCTETNDSFLHELPPGVTPAAPLPIGRPLPGVRALLVADDGTVVDGAGTGELLVSTPFQTDGYQGAAAGSGAFVAHPEGRDRRRYFRSGDLVRRDEDGQFALEGRTDFQVKVRGARVNPQEVEQVLLEHPQVAEAAVLALPDPAAGHLLHAVVRGSAGCPEEEGRLNSLVLRGHCARGLPRAAIPSTVRIVADPLPRTSTGKVDRDRVATAHLSRRVHDVIQES